MRKNRDNAMRRIVQNASMSYRTDRTFMAGKFCLVCMDVDSLHNSDKYNQQNASQGYKSCDCVAPRVEVNIHRR
jgi:hypothetical protein